MKSIVMPKNVQLIEKTDNQLSHEVKATSDNTINAKGKKKITVVDMWNSRRNRRSAGSMIRRWNLN